jgi:hypothetical protein
MGESFIALNRDWESRFMGVTWVHKTVTFSTDSVDNTVSKMFNRTARAMT